MENELASYLRNNTPDECAQYVSDWLGLCDIQVPSGVLAVMDPMLFPGVVLKVIPGRYEVRARLVNDAGTFLVAGVQACRAGCRVAVGSVHGYVNVEFAQVTIGDMDAIERGGHEITSPDLASAFLTALEAPGIYGQVPWGVAGDITTPFVRTPYGDGRFAVHELVSSEGLAGARVMFIEGVLD